MYKGYQYFKDNDGLWKVILSDKQTFIVALDDSKENGTRKIILKNNNEETCKRFIDWNEKVSA